MAAAATRRPRVSQRLRPVRRPCRLRYRRAQFPAGRRCLSEQPCRHQLRYPLGQGECRQIPDRSPTDRPGGNSTGGHLAMLAAMRPREPRYAAIPLPEGSPRVDASVRAVVMHWPIINPLSRYRSLLLEKGRFRYGIEYWQTEANAAEGNPMLMLERGERVDLPRAIWIQGRSDTLHNYRDPETDFPGNEPERFVSYYRRAGGDIELVYLEEASSERNALWLTREFLRKAVGAR